MLAFAAIVFWNLLSIPAVVISVAESESLAILHPEEKDEIEHGRGRFLREMFIFAFANGIFTTPGTRAEGMGR